MAGAYAHGHHESVLRSHTSRTVENSAHYLLPHLAAATTILDVGCGPGSLTADIAAHAPNASINALDASADVIEQAQRDHGAVASFATGDVYALDFPDAHFDIVHAHQVLQHLDRPIDALREMRRVTRPGGVVAARDADYAAMTWAPESGAMTRWMDVYLSLTAALGHDANAGRHLLGWAHAAGFTAVETTASIWCYAEPNSRLWWSEIWADRVVQSSYREHALTQNLATEAELAEMAAAFRSWATHPDGVFIVPHVEILAAR
jgi:SAM-dependent methyltransferase